MAHSNTVASCSTLRVPREGARRWGVVLATALACALPSTALAQAAQLTLTPTNPPSQGAAVRIDGADAGNLPLSLEVAAGRHLVQVGRRGYITFNLWIDVTAGQQLQLPVTLRCGAPIIQSFTAHTQAEVEHILAALEPQPLVGYELNASCPNAASGQLDGEVLQTVLRRARRHLRQPPRPRPSAAWPA